jgi:hypothetical protein
MTKRWTVKTEQDPDTGDLLLPLPDDLLEAAGFSEGDVLDWKNNEDGSYTLTKKAEQTEWVLVDTISQYRMRYLVEVPAGKTEYALDTVSWDEAQEFDQEWLGETILSHRTITEQEALDLFRAENDYFADWDDDIIKRNHFTFWVEDDE